MKNKETIERLLMKKGVIIDLIDEELPEKKAKAMAETITILTNFAIFLHERKKNAV